MATYLPTGPDWVSCKGSTVRAGIPDPSHHEPLQKELEPLQASRPDRLAAVFDYAEDRAGHLDVHQSVVAALEATDDLDTNERAELIVATIRDTTMRTIVRRLEHEPRLRELVAGFAIGVTIP